MVLFFEVVSYYLRHRDGTKGDIDFSDYINKGPVFKALKDLKKYFPGFKLVTEEYKTCSLTPIMKWFYNKDVDHIFVKGFGVESIGTLEGRSDHKLIYADLK